MNVETGSNGPGLSVRPDTRPTSATIVLVRSRAPRELRPRRCSKSLLPASAYFPISHSCPRARALSPQLLHAICRARPAMNLCSPDRLSHGNCALTKSLRCETRKSRWPRTIVRHLMVSWPPFRMAAHLAERESMNVAEAVQSRRSIRSFSKESVSLETVKRVLEIARWAPSG